ncbi:uncharacterized protein LOC133183838 [Saccostrea echinata]|uniref:uncharacterized protein LOC133183838 n=1 Tax=Saccostrea echinata TaxID=191078 RepID=UPI002A806C41|nr:uncharacterized protein LOC133183838 [Saccostrea echinata]
MTAPLYAFFLSLAMSFTSSEARVPQCLDLCDECRDFADGEYNVGLCQRNCFLGSTDPHCSKFLTGSIKIASALKIQACVDYCKLCQITYEQYAGGDCVLSCEGSGGREQDQNCLNYWPWKKL